MKERSDVLILCQYFHPDMVSSAQLPYDTAIALTEEGYKVNVLTGYPKEYNFSNKVKRREVVKGMKIKRVSYLQMKRSSIIGRLINYFSFTFSATLKLNYIRKADLIMVYSNPPVLPLVASLAHKLFKTKIMFISYDVYPEIAYETSALRRGSVLGKIMTFINSLVFNKNLRVVALSNEMKGMIVEKREGINEEQVAVIPNWDTTRKLVPEEQKVDKELRSLKNNDKLVISYFGNLGVAQDVDTVLSIIYKMKDHPDFHFLFAGHGNKVEDLKSHVTEHHLENVSIYPFLTGNDFEEALEASDFSIVSLGKNLNGLAVPSKTYTYLRAGIPVFAIMDKDTDIVRDIVKYKAGYHINHGESDKVLDYLEELNNHKESLNKMKNNASELYRDKYTKKHSTDKYIENVKIMLEED